VRLLQAGAWWPAAGNVVVTTALCLLLCVLGTAAGRWAVDGLGGG
jgi:fluoride ion exporter CrcB/FEX